MEKFYNEKLSKLETAISKLEIEAVYKKYPLEWLDLLITVTLNPSNTDVSVITQEQAEHIEATRIIEEETKILKSMDDKVLFVETLLNPPAPNKALKTALKDYNQFSKLSSNDLKGFRKKA